MSLNAKKILITTEKHEVWIIRHGDGRSPGSQCPLCGGLVDFDNLHSVPKPSSERGRGVLEMIGITDKTEIERGQNSPIQGEEYEQ